MVPVLSLLLLLVEEEGDDEEEDAMTGVVWWCWSVLAWVSLPCMHVYVRGGEVSEVHYEEDVDHIQRAAMDLCIVCVSRSILYVCPCLPPGTAWVVPILDEKDARRA